MTRLRANIAMSLDGYVAGPNMSEQQGLGEGGEQLHEWAFKTEAFQRMHGREGGELDADSQFLEEVGANIGAAIMGRRMFAPDERATDDSWQGWWGDEPPFGFPVFVLTHHKREPLTLGETTFTFVNDGIESALEQARAAAGDRDVGIGGGAKAIQQYLAAGLVDELTLSIVPVLLGAGERLLENVGDLKLEQAMVVPSETVTHVTYRVVS